MFDISNLNQSSFRGVPFYTTKTSNQGGQRLTNHTFINGGTKTETNGLKEEPFIIEGFVEGDDYLIKKENLKNALNIVGSGTLIDRFYGEIEAFVDTFTIDEDREKYGIATFKITFIKDENKPIETVQLLVTENIQDNAITFFKDNFNNELGLTAMEEVANNIQEYLGKLDNAVSFLDNSLEEIQNTKSTIGKTISNVKSNILSIESLANDIIETVSTFDDVFDLELFQKDQQIQFQNTILNNLEDLDVPSDDIVQQAINRSTFVYGATMTAILNQKAITNLENIDFTTGDEFGSVKDSSLKLYDLLENRLSELSETNTNITQTVELLDFMDKLKNQRTEYIFFYTDKYSRLQSLNNDDVVATVDMYNYTMSKYQDINRVDEVMTNNDILDPIFVNGNLLVLDK